eukprot:1240954-Pleurochrysis_carterae.AAC.1
MRWTSGGVNATPSEEFRELFRWEFAGIVAVDCADYACWCIASGVEECGEAGEELANVSRGFMLVA